MAKVGMPKAGRGGFGATRREEVKCHGSSLPQNKSLETGVRGLPKIHGKEYKLATYMFR